VKSLSAILVEQKKELALEQVEIPKLKYGQVLVKVYKSGICGSQLGEIDGVKGIDRFLPHLLGHEGVGVVVDAGGGVSTVAIDDQVVLHWRPSLGIQAEPPKYISRELGTVNAGWVTTFNEYAIVSENRLTRVPTGYNLDYAALMGCAVTTGLGVVNNNAKLKIGESIVVWGAGGVGLSIIQGAALTSAYPIIAIDIYDHKLQLAKKLGATHTINSEHQDADEEIASITNGEGADVVVDNTGNVSVIERAYINTKPSGRTILVGVPKKGDEIKVYSLPLHFGKKISGSHGGEAQPHVDIPNYIKLEKAKKLNLSHLVSARYSLADINVAIKDIRSGVISGRCMIDIFSD